MGRSIEKSGDTVARALLDEGRSLAEIKSIAVNRFSKKKELLFVCDHSILRKLFASRIEGTWRHYDGVLGTEVNGYHWFVVMLASGGVTLPWECKFELPQVLCPEDHETWLQIIQRIYADIQAHFPKTLITIVADGAFSTGNMLEWCTPRNVRAEMRMHKNRRVIYNGKSMLIREIKELAPTNLRRQRTIKAIWQGHHVFISSEKRVDKHGDKTIVYLKNKK